MQQLIEDDPHDGIATVQVNPARPTIEAIIEQITQKYKIAAQALWIRENQDAFKAGISEPRISQIQREVESRNASKTLKQLIRYYKVKN